MLSVVCLLLLGPTGSINPNSHEGPSASSAIPSKAVSGATGGPATLLVNVNAKYSQEPAPLGVADYGLGPSGAYQYATNSSLGSASISSLVTKDATGSPWMTFQLNVNLQFSDGNRLYVYWVQDVASVNTANNYIYFQNNIWNSSAPNASMSAAAVSGGGQIYASGAQTFYDEVAKYSLPGNSVSMPYPYTVSLRVNSSASASKQPMVAFEYNDGYGWQEYDVVVFDAVNQLKNMSGFVVDGFAYNPAGLFDDSELILGGAGDGSQTTDIQSDVRLQLEYWNGHNYQLVANAYNFGSDTGEGIQGAISQWSHYSSTGGVYAEVKAGSGVLEKLWNQSVIGMVDLKTSLSSGTLKVINSSVVGGTPDAYRFTGGEVTVVLQPGSYELSLYSGESLFTTDKYSLVAGELLELHTLLGTIPLTLSYSVVGGGSGYSPPTLTYVYNGTVETSTLGVAHTVYYLDSGSVWSVSLQLPGSSATERWQASQSVTGNASSPQTESITYYHQFLETVLYSVAGGGSGYSPPSLSGTQFGSPTHLPLEVSATSFWLDGDTTFAATNPLPGSTGYERWFASSDLMDVSGPNSVTFAYAHQFYLALIGGELQSEWYDSGTEAQLSEPNVYGRSLGNGERLVSYGIDFGQQNPIAPGLGNVTVRVLMNETHAISFATVPQYQVSLNASVAKAISSITPPTISGDNYWYDSGSTVSLVLQGAWGRAAGMGYRLVSYSINGGAQVQVGSTGKVTILSLASISSPQLVTGVSTAQFFLDTGKGSLVSVDPTPVPGDAGWYDDQTAVNAIYGYSWNDSTSQSRLNAVSYSIDGGPAVILPREGRGTFAVTVTMHHSHQIAVRPVAQFRFAYSGGFSVTLSSQSPTKDGFYDANSSITVTSSYFGDVVPNKERSALTGYVLDSASWNVPRNDSGTFTTPAITFDAYHSLTFESLTQYFLTFAFTDASGKNPMMPSSLVIDDGALGRRQVAGFNQWMDNGTTFTLASVIWGGEDVKPLGLAPRQVVAAENVTVHCRVYSASMKVVDLFGLAVEGASVAAALVNGTVATGTTDSSGVVSIGLIPIGTYQASISYLGVSTSTTADASIRGETTATIDVSVPVLGAVIITAAALGAGALFLNKRSRAKIPGENRASVPRS